MTIPDAATPDEGRVPRPSARVVLLDDADRLLLFSAEGPTRWFTVGGGVEEGETYEQAALRELREETGLTDVALGREIWRGRPWTMVRNGTLYEVRARYYVVRVPAFTINTSAFEQTERSAITGHRWWTPWRTGQHHGHSPACRTPWPAGRALGPRAAKPPGHGRRVNFRTAGT